MYLKNIRRQLRARRALSLFNVVSLRTRRVIPLSKVHGDSALLVLNRTLLNSINALMALNRRCFQQESHFFLNTFWRQSFPHVSFNVCIHNSLQNKFKMETFCEQNPFHDDHHFSVQCGMQHGRNHYRSGERGGGEGVTKGPWPPPLPQIDQTVEKG